MCDDSEHICKTKVCSKCKVEKRLDEFYKRKKTYDGHEASCKLCKLAYKQNKAKLFDSSKVKITEKICTKCGILKPLEQYYVCKSEDDGRVSRCKECSFSSHKISMKKYINSVKQKNLNSTIVVSSEKFCAACNELLPISEFYKSIHSNDGHANRCSSCSKAYRKANKIKNMNTVIDISEKVCTKCKLTKSISEFYTSNYHLDKHENCCKSCYNTRSKDYRARNPHIQKKSQLRRRGFGFNQINKRFLWCDSHHLHLENNHEFVINIPCWLHRLYSHNSNTWRNMDTVNAIALDFFVNEDFYKELYEL